QTAFSPDGTEVLTVGRDHRVFLWKLQAGQPVTPVQLGSDAVPASAATFSPPDGHQVLIVDVNGVLEVWDQQSTQNVGSFDAGDGSVTSVAYNPDGTRVVTAHADGTARVRTLNDPDPQHVLVLRPQAVSTSTGPAAFNDASFSRDGNLIVTAGNDNVARVWDAASGAQLAELRGHTGVVRTARFSNDGKHILTASDDWTARVWDTSTYTQSIVLRGNTAPVLEAVFDASGSQALTAGADGTVRQWDLSGLTLTLGGSDGTSTPQRAVAFSPDGRYLAGANDRWVVNVWNAQDLEQALQSLPNAASPVPIAPRTTIQESGAVYALAFSADGRSLLVGGNNLPPRTYDPETGGQRSEFPQPGKLRSVAFSPDGTHVAAVGTDQMVHIWDAQTLLPTGNPLSGHTDALTSVAYDPSGKYLVTASLDGTARVWDAQSHAQLHVLSVRQAATPLTVNAAGTQINLAPRAAALTSAAFSADGRRVVTEGSDGLVRIWDVERETAIATLPGAGNGVGSVVYSPDGHWILSAGNDGGARALDASDFHQIAELNAPNGRAITAVALNAGQRLMALAMEDGTLQLGACELCSTTDELIGPAKLHLPEVVTAQ
ncbi:MAG: WD40 repeat domain-containing protein, partial [Chloroflexi bacterium]|nr:WD40 repeat domain-containing protein [Chloroflexota bacterium]